MPLPSGGNINPTGAVGPARRWRPSTVIHGANNTTANVFSYLGPISEQPSSTTEPKPLAPTGIDSDLVTIPACRDESVVEAERVADDAEHLAPVDIPEPVTVSQPELPGTIESAPELVVEPPPADEKPFETQSTSTLTAHHVTCEYCGASVSKLRRAVLQIGSGISQWAKCPTCSSARRISSILIRSDRDDGLWFLPLQYLFRELRGRRRRDQRALFVDCTPDGSFVPLGQRVFREATVLSELSKVKGRKYDVVEAPFLLETGLGLKEWLTGFNSNLGKHSVIHLITLRRPYFSKPNSTEGWAGARLENLVQFASIRGIETLMERSGFRIVKTRPKVVAPLTARNAERLASASGVERCWLMLLVCWTTLLHTVRYGRAYQLSLQRVENTPRNVGKVKDNVSKAR